jgi:quinoprotein glucose dehydrogenase
MHTKSRDDFFFRRALGLGILLMAAAQMGAPAATNDWPSYLGDPGRAHYSALSQIDRENVSQLEVAWTYRAEDGRNDNLSQIQCNPLIIDGILYGTTPQLKLFALNAATGREIWRFDPAQAKPGINSLGLNRGVVCWGTGGSRRILYSADHFLFAVDAATGRLVESFGASGMVDIKEDLGRDVSKLYVVSTTPGTLFENLLILPLRVGEGPAPAAPGHVRAYDVRSGKIVWTFHTIPQPGEFGYDTWPTDAWRYVGGVNCWAGMALDEKRAILFVPTGSATFDFWGGNRLGSNLFSDCLLALDARTGKRIWHYQFVHHDLWDRDLPAPPTLLSVKRGGREIDAVSQTTKSGHVFVFNRETGEPLFPIEERQVPPSELQGETAWPTQPLPTKPAPFTRQLLTYNELNDLSPDDHRAALNRLATLRTHVPFAPPSTQGTIIFPGFDGGAEWGGAAADPGGVLYVNASEMPWVLTLRPTEREMGARLDAPQLFSQICAPCHGAERQGNAGHNIPPLTNIVAKLARADIVRLLGTGRGAMPSFGFLSDNQKGMLADMLLGVPAQDVRPSEPAAGDEILGDSPYTFTGYQRWLDTNGYPVIKPPWGTLSAIDLNTGEYRWQVPLGEVPELTAKGIPLTGTENYGGPIVTAGELLFIGASRDERLRAFDSRTGKLLWQTNLPAGGYATPATYAVNGRQYVVIACGGGKMGTKSGDAYVAFALPRGK